MSDYDSECDCPPNLIHGPPGDEFEFDAPDVAIADRPHPFGWAKRKRMRIPRLLAAVSVGLYCAFIMVDGTLRMPDGCIYATYAKSTDEFPRYSASTIGIVGIVFCK